MTDKRNTAIFINGGAGRVLASIPALEKFAEENPEVLVRFLRAIDEATIFIEDNEKKTHKIVAERLNIKEEDVALHWDEFIFELSLSQSFLINIESEARWAIRRNLVNATKIPEYLNYIYFNALDSIVSRKRDCLWCRKKMVVFGEGSSSSFNNLF